MAFLFSWLKKSILAHKKEGVYGVIFVFLVGFGGDFLRHWYEQTGTNTKGRKENARFAQESRKRITENSETIQHYIDHHDTLWIKQGEYNQQLGIVEGEMRTISSESDRLLQQGLRANESKSGGEDANTDGG